MADFQNVDLGKIMQTAELIKGARRQAETDQLRNAYLGVQTQNAQDANTRATQDQLAQTDAAAARQHFLSAQAVESAPDPVAAAKQFAPEFVSDYEGKFGQGSFDQLQPDQVKQMAGVVKQKAAAAAGINLAPQQRIGVVRPEDYTPESLAKYQTSGNTGDLVRVVKPTAAPKAAPVNGFNDPNIQALQAAFVTAGYSPPAGFRSKEQQLAMYQGLLKRYDGLAPDDIAHLAASNAIDYKSVGKATQAAATMGGRVEVANNELRGFIPIAKDASAAVDRGSFVPFNRLKQMGQASISDPNLKRLYVATQTVLNAYDVLAARGGTDKDKRAENHRILENADSPEAYNAALDMITREGQAAGKATQDAMKAGAFNYPTGQPQQPDANQRLSVEDAAKLPSGTPFIGMDGVPRVKH